MIEIKNSDTVVDVLKKIDKEKSDKIMLIFPFWHPILHNHLSLKIIQTKSRNKKLVIVSNDKTAKKIGKLLWIKFVKNKKNNISEIKSNLDNLKENYSFLEYAKFEIKNFFNKFSWDIKNNKKVNRIYYFKNKYNNTNKKIIPYLVLILIIIFFILLYIFYFAINKTVVTIYPEIDVRVKLKNFTFAEKNNNKEYIVNNQVQLNRIKESVFLEKTIVTSGIKQKDNNFAKWEVVFYNLLKEKVYLLKNTTLKSKDWVLFYIKEDITIPPSTLSESWKIIPWKLTHTLYWKDKLSNWKYSGTKTNIWTGVLLTIPKLDKLNRSKIFAKSTIKFTWASDSFTKVLKKEDIENAKKLMIENLKTAWIKKIKDNIDNINKNNSLKIELLPVDNIFKFNNLKVNIPKNLKVWDEIDKFTISWKVDVFSFTYNKEVVISLLKNKIEEWIIPSLEKIVSIDEKSLRFSYVIKRNDLQKIAWKYEYTSYEKTPFRIKGTLEIEYNVSKKFDNKDALFNNKIKFLISWKPIDKAEKILTNRPEINNVKIDVQPFFLNSISKIPENIKIDIEN